ncbi:MAG: GspE/PulE family protein [bacterium]
MTGTDDLHGGAAQAPASGAPVGPGTTPHGLAAFGELPGEEAQYPISFCERHRVVLLRDAPPSHGPPQEAAAHEASPEGGLSDAAVVGVAAPVPWYLEGRLRRIHGAPVRIVPLIPHDLHQFLAHRRLGYEGRDAGHGGRAGGNGRGGVHSGRRARSERFGPWRRNEGPVFAAGGAVAAESGGAVRGAGEALLQGVLEEAVRTGASDAHLMAGSAGFALRFRREGILGEARAVPGELAVRLLARLKVRIRGNPGQRRKPQEGRFDFAAEGTVYEVRASILPGLHGESVSLRFLKTFKGGISLDTLGFPGRIVTLLSGVARRTEGLFLVTGPTGSGKTTTLHAVARLLCRRDRRVVTIEDPIEYELPEAVQLQTSARLHLTFDLLLSKALRHDPDVILLGEIRDAETAALAVRTALTGHLVLATMHTGTVFTGVLRLRNLGATREEVASALCGVLSQRLVRRATGGIAPAAAAASSAGVASSARAGLDGDTDGRIPISEALVDPADVTESGTFGRLVEAAGREWLYFDMEDDARRLVSAGVTTWDEVERVARMGRA